MKESKFGDIINCIKEFGDDGISAKEIADLLQINLSTIYQHAHKFRDYDIFGVDDMGNINWRKGRTKRYVYKPQKGVFRNAEGYLDKTAGEAITNMDKGNISTEKIMPGVIYGKKNLVLKAFSDMVVYLEVLPVKKSSEYLTPICVQFYIGYEEYFVNPHRVWSTPVHKIDTSEKDVIDMKTYREIVGLAGMNVVEVRGEPEIIEKVVEKVVPGPAVSEDLEKALYKQKAEIYEKVLFALIEGRKVV